MPDSRWSDADDERAVFLSSLDDMLVRVSDFANDPSEDRQAEAEAVSAPKVETGPPAVERASRSLLEEAMIAASSAGKSARREREQVKAPALARERPVEVPPLPRRSGVSRVAATWWSGVAIVLAFGGAVAWRRHAEVPVAAATKTTAAMADPLARLAPPAAGAAPSAPRVPPPPVVAPAANDASSSHDAEASVEVAMLKDLDAVGIRLPDPSGRPAPIAIARYDTLARADAGRLVIAPLHVETVYALVKADSPRRHLHDLRDARIDIGDAASARAASGRALYRSLFGASLPPSAALGLPRDVALRRLLAGDGVDALLVFDGQPSPWLAGLPQADRRRLRLLTLDPADASTRGALRTYLQSSVAPLVAGGEPRGQPVLAEVAFLVAQAGAVDASSVARSLCEQLPALRRAGQPVWRDVRPSLRLPSGLPVLPGADEALSICKAADAAS